MDNIKALLRGMIEFRSSFTWGCDDIDVMEWYDYGRDLAHRLTFRKFDF